MSAEHRGPVSGRSVFDLLELQEDDQPRLLGRAWALADAICSIAEDGAPYTAGGSNTLRATYGPYGRRPAQHYPRMIRQAAKHLDAARARRPDLASRLWDALTHVGALIGPEIPTTLTNEQASTLVTGDYAQRARILADDLETTQAARDRAMAAAKAWAVELAAAGMSEVEIGRRLGLNRMTVRSALGK